MRHFSIAVIASLVACATACESDDGCYGPLKVNFLHTTDTHGWLEGHIKEQNYGADWGDYVSFTKRMKEKAEKIGVDLLLVDTGVCSNLLNKLLTC
jgi:2',3'-cyclic-nucleotide 2'-phosphodiesterase (5'-nucleotidase family)